MKHSSNAVYNIIKNLDTTFFKTKKTKSGILIQHIPSNTQYLCHLGERGKHPLRRYLLSLDNLNYNNNNNKSY